MKETNLILFKRVLEKDPEALRELFLGMQPRMFGFARQFARSEAAAKDIVQDTFLSFWEHCGSINSPAAVPSYLFKILKSTCLRHVRLDALNARFKNMAALAVGVLGGWFVNMVAQRNVPETVAVSTGTGQHAETILPDGTKVTLDPCSRLTYSLTDWKKQRHVSLCGEGFFDVTGDPGRPFTVGTSGFDVKVLGTVFKVSAYEDETEGSVVLKSGRVQMLFPGDNTGVALAAGDLCTFNNETGSYRVTKAAENDLASWKTYELRFDGKELHEMTGELYRHFGYTFILSDDVRKLVYKATVRDESLRDFLRILETVTPQLVTRTDKESRTVYLSLR